MAANGWRLIKRLLCCGVLCHTYGSYADARCALIAADQARLACYDGLYQSPPATAIPTEPDDASQPPSRSVAATTAQSAESASQDDDSFGRETIKAPQPVNEIQSTIESITVQPRGHRLFRLHNGQSWREIEVGRSRFKENMPVEVVRTPFGGYLLKAGKGRRTKVRRVD